jgi:hypothetical protein
MVIINGTDNKRDYIAMDYHEYENLMTVVCVLLFQMGDRLLSLFESANSTYPRVIQETPFFR